MGPLASVSLPAFGKKEEKIHFRAARLMLMSSIHEGHTAAVFPSPTSELSESPLKRSWYGARVGGFLRLAFLWVSPSPNMLVIP